MQNVKVWWSGCPTMQDFGVGTSFLKWFVLYPGLCSANSLHPFAFAHPFSADFLMPP